MKTNRMADHTASKRKRAGKPGKTVGQALAQARAMSSTKGRLQAPPARTDDGLRLRGRLRALYHGSSPAAVRFRLTVLWIDFLIILLFIFLMSPV